MTTSRDELFAYLDGLGISHNTVEHREIFTVEDGEDIKKTLPGGHSKNLFLKDKKGRLFLISALGNTKIRLNQLHKVLGCARLSFASAELMQSILGVTPGSVTAFALINDTKGKVTFVLDKALLETNPVNFHPLKNNATTAISATDLILFANKTNHDPVLVDFTSNDGEAALVIT
ncbi:MAG: prolyl-tRNA synthetase associated domain-containing protein [Robiginitomaculum sp.]|nr:prolyl-tRNA synthetase associated domain-containing protein [Robiginitomaculum sp.]